MMEEKKKKKRAKVGAQTRPVPANQLCVPRLAAKQQPAK